MGILDKIFGPSEEEVEKEGYRKAEGEEGPKGTYNVDEVPTSKDIKKRKAEKRLEKAKSKTKSILKGLAKGTVKAAKKAHSGAKKYENWRRKNTKRSRRSTRSSRSGSQRSGGLLNLGGSGGGGLLDLGGGLGGGGLLGGGGRRKELHVVPDDDPETYGNWMVVDAAGPDHPISNHNKKSAAKRKAKRIARDEKPSQVVIHRKDGSIMNEVTYGSDPGRTRR